MLQLSVNNRSYSVEKSGDEWLLNGAPAGLDLSRGTEGIISILHEGKSYAAFVEKVDKAGRQVTVRIGGKQFVLAIREPMDQLLEKMGMGNLNARKAEPVRAPMPGMILKILVTAGQQINKGDGLLVLEAMKMENVLKATTSATVRNIAVAEKTAVEKGAVLIELE